MLGAEGAQAQHGTKIDKLLEDHLNKSNFQNIDEAVGSLSSKFKQPNWQPPDLKGYIEKDSSKVLPKISEDVLDQPSTVRGLDVNKMKIGGGLRTADSLAQIASGNVVGGGVGLALQQEPVQKQIAKLLAKRAAKTSANLVPGVDIGLSAAEAAQYFASGNYIQGGIASLSGAVGWIPGVGDAASAALDFTNTGIDINKLKAKGIANRHKKIDGDDFNLRLKGFK